MTARPAIGAAAMRLAIALPIHPADAKDVLDRCHGNEQDAERVIVLALQLAVDPYALANGIIRREVSESGRMGAQCTASSTPSSPSRS